MVQYANEAIARYKKQLVTNAEKPKGSLFTRLYNATADELTVAEIRDEAISYLIAGSDTTATSLTYLVWAVCHNPSIEYALLEEVNSLPPRLQRPRYSSTDVLGPGNQRGPPFVRCCALCTTPGDAIWRQNSCWPLCPRGDHYQQPGLLSTPRSNNISRPY